MSTIKPKKGKCMDCPNDSPEKFLTAGRCEPHYWLYRRGLKEPSEFKIRKPIRKTSKKRDQENREYTIKRLQFLVRPENLKCPVTGQMTTEVHHMRGRVGSLLLDERYWLAVSREGHRKIEENPQWAKEMGYSLNRL